MNTLKIDLSGIEHKFSARGRQICADCGRNCDGEDDDPDDPDAPYVPLLLWKNGGKLMLTLCWPCATKRMGGGEHQRR